MKSCRAMFISDVHLGSKDCKAERLLAFLEHNNPQTLYLLGDIVDFWALKRRSYWPTLHTAILKQLQTMALSGTRIIYVPGNHDGVMRGFNKLSLPNIETHLEYDHVTADGRRIRLIHGDRFDGLFCSGKLLAWIGDHSYNLLLKLNRVHHAWQKWRGQPYYSLSADLKMRPAKARETVDRFRTIATNYARDNQWDGIMCGHIHRPDLRVSEGIYYINTGDWVEHCSAIIEDEQGQLSLITEHKAADANIQPTLEAVA